MLVKDLISYRNRAHVTGYNGLCKKETQKRGFLNDDKGIDTIDLLKTLQSDKNDTLVLRHCNSTYH